RRRENEMSSALATRISQEHASAASALPASVISLERRRNALQALETRGLPSSREENWKYANLRPLEKVRFAPVAHALSPDAAHGLELPPPIAGYSRYTFVDGVFAPELS